jgi:hypothetical protein
MMPAAKNAHGDKGEDVRRLFAELDAAYQRAAEAASPANPTDTSNRGKLVDEGSKALAIIKRIREADGL